MTALDTSLGPEARAALLARNPLLSRVQPSLIASLARFTHVRSMRRGETLFRAGDPGSSMMTVIQGEVRIQLPGSTGRDIVLNRIRAGEVFGEIALLDGRPRTADAVVITGGRLLVLERREIQDAIRRSPELALALLEVLCERLRNTSTRIAEAVRHDMGRRLAASLLDLTPDAEGWIRVTQSELGGLVHSRRETVCRRLGDWERRGVVVSQQRGVRILDRPTLLRIAQADSLAA